MEKIYTSILLMSLALIGNAQAPTIDWAGQIGIDPYGYSNDMVTDANGNIYCAGEFDGTADFDPSAGVQNYTALGTDGFVQKLDATGNLIWAKQITGGSSQAVSSLAIDPNGNVYITGEFQGTADFDPGSGTFNMTSAGSRDVFVQKMDSNGDFLWAKQMGGTNSDEGSSIDVDTNENVYVTGYFRDAADFDPGVGIQTLTSNGNSDVFIEKLDANGDFVWVKQIGGTGWDNGTSMNVAENGNIYTIGHCGSTADFDPGAGTYDLTSSGQSAVFIEKLDPNGNFVWAKNLTGTAATDYTNYASSTIDENENIYLTGRLSGFIDLDPGPGVQTLTSNGLAQAIFIEKLDVNGDLVWANSIGGDGITALSIALDMNGSPYITGDFQGTFDFDPSADSLYLTSAGSDDIYIQKMDTDGNFAWAQQIGGVEYDWGSAIALDNNNDILLTGGFVGTVDFDLGAATINLTSVTLEEDIFILKLDNCVPVTNSVTITNCFSYTTPSGNATYTTSGIYNDTLTNACGSDSILIIELTINTIDVSVMNSDPTLTATSSSATYQWLECPAMTEISGETSQSYTPTSNGNYAVIVTENGCSDTSTCYAVASVNVDELSFGDKISLYPNPTNQDLTLDLGKVYNEIQIQIVNPLGQIISKQEFEMKETLNLEIEGASGVYYVIIESEEGRTIRKVIKK